MIVQKNEQLCKKMKIEKLKHISALKIEQKMIFDI